jgi:RNA polymerase sigma-70 factor (ECF subfamily)
MGTPVLSQPPADEATLLARLRARDEQAFAGLVERYHGSLKRVARSYVSTDSVAEEVVQETWLAVIAGLDRFEGRSSLKTWIFHILANQAKRRGERERRIVPFASIGGDDDPAVPADRFQGNNDRYPGNWAIPPRPWTDPGRRLGSLELRDRIKGALDALPPVQQTVVTLRDVEGLSADEVCDLLELSPGNQRVILHRARARVREALEDYMAEEAT